MNRRYRRDAAPGAGQTLVAADATTASCATQISGRAFVNAANDLYAGGVVAITRWNRSRLIRLTNWLSTAITFTAISTAAANGYLAVVVDGTIFATVHQTTVAIVETFTVGGMAAGAKTVEIWEDWQQRTTHLSNGSDAEVSGTYVKNVLVPPHSGNFVKATATHGVVVIGDSILDGDATQPWAYYGWVGQLRKICHTAGWLLSYYGYGSRTMCQDGPTAAQTAQIIHDLWVNMGSTTKYLLVEQRPNDYAYVAFGGTTTPTQYATYLGTLLDTLASLGNTYTADIITPIPQGATYTGANGLGFTLANYGTAIAGVASGRSYVNIRDGSTAFGLVLTASLDYAEAAPDQTHLGSNAGLGQNGHDKLPPVVRQWWGI